MLSPFARLPQATFRLSALLLLAALATAPARADDWPQWLGPKRDGVWRETGILEKFPKGGPKVLWRKPLGPGYTGPAVANGRVYVQDRQRPGDGVKKMPVYKLGPGKERVLCLSAADGKEVWKHEYDCTYFQLGYPSGPRATPLVEGDRVYTLGAMGHLFCLDAGTGKVVWSKDFRKDYKAPVPFWGWASHPLVEGDRLICTVGGDGQAVMAFDKRTGKQLWKALTTEEIGYSPPTLIEAGGKRQVVVWLSDSLNGLDPATGKVLWSVRYPENGMPQRPSVSIATPRRLDDLAFVSTFYHGTLAVRLNADRPTARVAWRGKSNNPGRPDGIHSVMCTPVGKGNYLYGVGGWGDLVCVEADTGKTVWQTYKAVTGEKAFCGTAFIVEQGDRYFLFNDQGHLIIARLTPKRYDEISRARVLLPTQETRERLIVWSHPAFANRCAYVRNDEEIVCVSLAAPGKGGQGK
jgi:outer membrane protein assembly factor BamB